VSEPERIALTTLTRATRPGQVHGALWVGDLRGMEPILRLHGPIEHGPGLRGLAVHEDRYVVGVWGGVWIVDGEGRVLTRLDRRACPALRDVHAIAVEGDRAWIACTGSDSVVGLDLQRGVFDQGVCIREPIQVFDPRTQDPGAGDSWHLNQVHLCADGLVLSGLRSTQVLLLDRQGTLGVIGEVPPGTHDVQPHRGGLLYNDTARDRTVWEGPEGRVSVPVPRFALQTLTGIEAADGGMARQAFARGLAVIDEDHALVGSSPGTLGLVDLSRGRRVSSLTFHRDLRVAVHAVVGHAGSAPREGVPREVP